MDKRLMGIILAIVVGTALLMYFSRDVLFEMKKLRRPHEQATEVSLPWKEAETTEPTFKLSAELLQSRAENAEARGDWATARKYYKSSLSVKDSEVAKKGLRIMDMLIDAKSLEKKDHLHDALEVYRVTLPMVGSHTRVKIQEAIQNVEGRIIFDRLLSKAQSLEAWRNYAGALKVLKDAEKIAKDAEQISALREMRIRIAKAKERTPRITPQVTPQITSRTCANCRGEGRIKCATCQAKRQIRKTCGQCKGRGYFTCRTCQGEGQLRCGSCGGDGREICTGCGGTGRSRLRVRRNGQSYYPRCSSCNGRGSFQCRRCRGRGLISCSYCSAGKSVCRTCGGSGSIIRQIRCAKCKRTGFIPCPNCQGTGKIDSVGE